VEKFVDGIMKMPSPEAMNVTGVDVWGLSISAAPLYNPVSFAPKVIV
jgi:hypothetical protein